MPERSGRTGILAPHGLQGSKTDLRPDGLLHESKERIWRAAEERLSTQAGLKRWKWLAPQFGGWKPDNATDGLLEFGAGFLAGDVGVFRQVRWDPNRDRAPDKVYSPDRDGKHTVPDEPESVKLKEKYS